jgi:hypothetical protein
MNFVRCAGERTIDLRAKLLYRFRSCNDNHDIARLQDCFACDDLSVVVPYNRRQQSTFGERKFSDRFADDGGRSS